MKEKAQGMPHCAMVRKACQLVPGDPALHSLQRFRAKWNPVRVKKTRQNKNLEATSVSAKR
jgi:hypothetical protein